MHPRSTDGFPGTRPPRAYKLRSRAAVLALTFLTSGCFLLPHDPAPPQQAATSTDLVVAEIDPLPHPSGTALNWHAVKNEWLDAFLQVNPSAEERSLRLDKSSLPADVVVRVYRVESVPTNTISVSAVRDAGPGVANARLPTALIPIERAADGGFPLPADATLLYFELKSPIETPPGTYSAILTLGSGGGGLPLSLTLDDVALSESPEFALYGQADFNELAKLFPGDLGKALPQTLTRGEGADLLAVERLDSLVRLARDNRVNIGFSRLQPIVKNSPREGVRIDWSSYDSVVLPWLSGEYDLSRPGLSAFPLPTPDVLATGGLTVKQLLASAVSHFDQNHLLTHTFLPAALPGELLPHNEAAAKIRRPENIELPSPLSDRGVRYLAWRAFAEGNQTVTVGEVAPLGEARNDHRQVWFYPGSMFGTKGVVPALGIKSARRAVQDYQIFELAQQRGARPLAQTIARKAARLGVPTVGYGDDLLAPAVSRQTWEGGLAIVRAAMVARPPGTLPDPAISSDEADALARWSAPLDVAPILPAQIEYAPNGNIRATLAIADRDAAATLVRPPEGWGNVTAKVEGTRLLIEAHLDPALVRYPVTKAIDDRNQPLPPNGTLKLRSAAGADRVGGNAVLRAPAAWVVPSVAPIQLDGKLDEWSDSETIHAGGLTRMLDRYSAQSGQPTLSPKSTDVFARWDDAALYIAIRAEAVGPQPGVATNVIPTDHGRAHGQDLVRLVLTPQGRAPIRLTAKPQSFTVESPNTNAITSASTLENGTWRCEIRIPADVLGPLHADDLLPFNLTRHDASTGESASWAGPVDQDFQPWSGLLILGDKIPK